MSINNQADVGVLVATWLADRLLLVLDDWRSGQERCVRSIGIESDCHGRGCLCLCCVSSQHQGLFVTDLVVALAIDL
jgi:hypothetical protein